MKQQYTLSLVNHKMKISSAFHVSEVVGVIHTGEKMAEIYTKSQVM
jgi:ABC-type branched-subunit amino acid transport system ATPase component